MYGPATVAAVEALQKEHGLPVTGAMDKATEAALRSDLAAKGGVAAEAAVASTAALQQTLKLAGYWDGPVDGQWTNSLTDALKALQKDLGVPETGTVDATTVSAFEKAIGKSKETPTVTTTVTQTTTVSPSPTSGTTGADGQNASPARVPVVFVQSQRVDLAEVGYDDERIEDRPPGHDHPRLRRPRPGELILAGPARLGADLRRRQLRDAAGAAPRSASGGRGPRATHLAESEWHQAVSLDLLLRHSGSRETSRRAPLPSSPGRWKVLFDPAGHPFCLTNSANW